MSITADGYYQWKTAGVPRLEVRRRKYKTSIMDHDQKRREDHEHDCKEKLRRLRNSICNFSRRYFG